MMGKLARGSVGATGDRRRRPTASRARRSRTTGAAGGGPRSRGVG
jgi:hypothetical protein